MSPNECARAINRLADEIKALRESLASQRSADDLLSAKQAAKVLGITERAVRQAAWRGTVPSVHVGRRLRFRRGELVKTHGR